MSLDWHTYRMLLLIWRVFDTVAVVLYQLASRWPLNPPPFTLPWAGGSGAHSSAGGVRHAGAQKAAAAALASLGAHTKVQEALREGDALPQLLHLVLHPDPVEPCVTPRRPNTFLRLSSSVGRT
jgi:hypothetical protein